MNSKIFFTLFALTLFMNCNSDDTNSILESSDVIRVDDQLFQTATNDAFQIIDAAINGNQLNLTIAYGGGCGEAFYDLVTSTDYVASSPIQRNIRLAFDDRDNCEALLELDLSFDLAGMQVLTEDSLLVNLAKWPDQLTYKY